MTVINDRTTNLNLPLPNAANQLADDVDRLRTALNTIDTLQTFAALTSKPTTVSGFGITDVYTKAQVDSSFTALINSAPSNLNTLGEIATQIQTDEAAHSSLLSTVNSHVGSTTGHPLVTSGSQGMMSAADKIKVDAFNSANYIPSGTIVAYTPPDLGGISLSAGLSDGALAMVEGYGIYKFSSTSIDIADGETVVAPTSGAGNWLLIAPSWDFVWTHLAGLFDYRSTQTSASNIIRLNVSATPGALSSGSSETVNFSVPGASVGDFCWVTPPNQWQIDNGMWFAITSCYIATAGIVTAAFINNDGVSHSPGTYTFQIVVIK